MNRRGQAAFFIDITTTKIAKDYAKFLLTNPHQEEAFKLLYSFIGYVIITN